MSELIYSKTALKNQIYNMPRLDELDNLLELIINVLQPIRDQFKSEVIINSGYRNQKLNTLVKGAKNSQHLKGQAADFTVKNHTIEEVIDWIKENLVFDQLINEYDKWIHVSYNSRGINRKEVLYLKTKK
ncbi:MAG: DUF882 domain-containing protein [Candidatus Gastranaerophilales bacterium]|nr:DUF882 domain-containing protein [Candidatus Gastranaerophilales bacterium]